MKDLDFKFGQVFYKNKAIKPIQEIASIYEDKDGFVTVNFKGFAEGSYPCCEKDGYLKIKNGNHCDEIRLSNSF